MAADHLESEINNLLNMARIASNQIEEAVGGSHEEITRNRHYYYLPEDQVERIVFSIYHLENLIRDFRDEYLAHP